VEEPPAGTGPAADAGDVPAGDEPSEEELRRRIEEGLRKVRMQDVLLESVVTIINLTARRIGKADERDLDQARLGIDAVRAVVDLLEPEPQTQVRNALSELQMLYARHAGGEADEGEEGAPKPAGGEADTQGGDDAPGADSPPKGEPPPGLWVPPGS
jgi:hypothetical protein